MRAVLEDRQAEESDRLLAAELAGEVVVIDDDLAGTLLSLVGDAAASEPLRCRAALSLGPVLEQMDLDGDDDFLGLDEEVLGAPPISEHTPSAGFRRRCARGIWRMTFRRKCDATSWKLRCELPPTGTGTRSVRRTAARIGNGD